MTYSEVCLTGIVTDISLNSDIFGIKRPVARLTTLNSKTNEWNENIFACFSDNAQARQFRAINIGSVLLVTGEVFYQHGKGYMIYVNKYVILEKNNEKRPIYIQRVFLSGNYNIDNKIIIKGSVISNNNNIYSITHNLNNSYRGDVMFESVEPIEVVNNPPDDIKDCLFIGNFDTTLLKGNLYKLC